MSRDVDEQRLVWREFADYSLRTRPCKTERFQAGMDNSCSSVKRVKPNDALYEKVRSCRTTRSSKLSVDEDTIEFDAYKIAMSYPEGRQKLLDWALDKSAKSPVSRQLQNSTQTSYIEDTVMNEMLMDSAADGVNTGQFEEKIDGQKDKIESKDTEHSIIVPDGSLLWGKIGKQWWPAIKITGAMAGQPVAGHSHLWLMWFGDHRISRVKHWHAVSFGRHFKQHYNGKHDSAVLEALKVCLDRCELQIDGDANILEWGQVCSGLESYVCNSETDPFLPVRGCEFPVAVIESLEELRMGTQSVESSSDGCRRTLLAEHGTVDKCMNIHQPGFCVCCARQGQTIVCQHPLFEGSVCSPCKDRMLESLLVIDDDGYYMYCCVCGGDGLLCVCEEVDCGRSFCVLCLNRYLSNNSLLKIENSSAWTCLICSSYTEHSHGVLIPRLDSNHQLVIFYNPSSSPISLPVGDHVTGRRLRVLSLNDGIGAVRVALDQLGLDIGKYYIAESNIYAQRVTGHRLTVDKCLHDVTSITKELLQTFGRIDLVVASLSSEQMGTTNQNGYMCEVVKILSIIKQIKALCHSRGDNPVYWIIEGPISMKSSSRNQITHILKVEHSMWDAQFLSPYICPKLYWGNVPGLNSAVQCYNKNKDVQEMLDKYLTPVLDRKANVNILRSVAIGFNEGRTKGNVEIKPLFNFYCNDMEKEVLVSHDDCFGGETVCEYGVDVESLRTGSLMQESSKAEVSMHTLPVWMNDQKSVIWATEVERVLGLPPHYTDCPEVSIQQRQKLLKRTTSVNILKEILKPLLHVFVTK